jgi:hypothetical protein
MDTRTYGRLVEEYRVRVDLPKSFVDAPPPLPARARRGRQRRRSSLP